MAGSIKTMIYTADDQTKWCVDIDESNGEAFGFDDYTGAATDPKYYLPRRMQMRYVNWSADSGRISRRFPIGKPNNPLFLNGGSVTVPIQDGSTSADSIDATGQVTSSRGEKRRLPRATDTGLTGGDAS